MASGKTPFGIYVGTRDLTIMHSVVDILGINALTRRILANAAGAITGMCDLDPLEEESGRPSNRHHYLRADHSQAAWP